MCSSDLCVSVALLADSLSAKAIAINDKFPTFYIRRARINSVIDFSNTKWLSIPYYEKFVEVYVRVQKGPDYPAYARTSVLTYQMIAEKPVVNDLPQLKMPVLLVIGQKDRTVFGRRFAPPEAVKSLGNFPELGKKAQSVIPNAKLVPIENVGHVPHVEVPDQFVKIVVEFLNSKG